MFRDIVERVERVRSRDGSDDADDVADGPAMAGFEFDQPLVDDPNGGDDADGAVGDDAEEADRAGDDRTDGRPERDHTDGRPERDRTDGRPERDRTDGRPERDHTDGRPERDRVRPGESTADGPAGFRPLDAFEGPVASDVSPSAGDDAYEEALGAVVGDLASVLDRTTGVVAVVARGLERGELVVAETGGGDDRTAREVARAAVAEVATLLVLRRRLADVEAAVAELGGGDAAADPPADVRAAFRGGSALAGDGSGPAPGARVDALAAEVEEAADEANLLAFNAAVDAAEGGDRADWFARAADEVQSVAEDSREEVSEVATLTAPVRAAGGEGPVAGGESGVGGTSDGGSDAGGAPGAVENPHACDEEHSPDVEDSDATG